MGGSAISCSQPAIHPATAGSCAGEPGLVQLQRRSGNQANQAGLATKLAAKLALTLPNDGQDDAGGRVEQQHAQPHAAQGGSREQQPAGGAGRAVARLLGGGQGRNAARWADRQGEHALRLHPAAHVPPARSRLPTSPTHQDNHPATPPAHAKERDHEEVHDEHRGAGIQARQQRHGAGCRVEPGAEEWGQKAGSSAHSCGARLAATGGCWLNARCR